MEFVLENERIEKVPQNFEEFKSLVERNIAIEAVKTHSPFNLLTIFSTSLSLLTSLSLHSR